MPWVETLEVICFDKNTSHFETSEAPVIRKEEMGDVLWKERCTQTDEVRSEPTNILSWFMPLYQTGLCHPSAQRHSRSIPYAVTYAVAWRAPPLKCNYRPPQLWLICMWVRHFQLIKVSTRSRLNWGLPLFFKHLFHSFIHNPLQSFSMWLATTARVGFP